MSSPVLLKGSDLPVGDIPCDVTFFRKSPTSLEYTTDMKTVEWTQGPQVAWIPVITAEKLYGGTFDIDFGVNAQGGQIGIGFMLHYDAGVDWGFFGYLGASATAWSYDPSTGDVVTSTESIESNLNKLDGPGTVSLHLELPTTGKGSAHFTVGGKASKLIELPSSSVVLLAGCLLKKKQTITLQRFMKAQ